MRNIWKDLTVVMLILAVSFTAVPAATGTMGADAASGTKALSASASGQHSVNLKWGKLTTSQKKKVSGITIFRDGAAVKNISKKASSYSDSGLKAGTSYTYQVKTYKKKVKKVKMWYNKATGKWQKKKPAKKNRGKKKTVKTVSYKYSNASPAKTVKTASVTTPSGSSSGSSGSGSGSSATSMTVTDYRGETYTMLKVGDKRYWDEYDLEHGIEIPKSTIIRCDRTVPGEFTDDGGKYIQKNGVTFRLE